MKTERGWMLVKSDAYYILDGADELEAQQRADELGEGWEVQQYVIRPAAEDDAREAVVRAARKLAIVEVGSIDNRIEQYNLIKALDALEGE